VIDIPLFPLIVHFYHIMMSSVKSRSLIPGSEIYFHAPLNFQTSSRARPASCLMGNELSLSHRGKATRVWS